MAALRSYWVTRQLSSYFDCLRYFDDYLCIHTIFHLPIFNGNLIFCDHFSCDMLQPPAHPSTLAANGYTLNIITNMEMMWSRQCDYEVPRSSPARSLRICGQLFTHYIPPVLLLSENLIDTVRIPNRFPGFPGDIPRPMIVRFKPLVRDSSGPLCIRRMFKVSKRILENVRRFFNSASCLFQNFCLLLWPVLFSAFYSKFWVALRRSLHRPYLRLPYPLDLP